MSAAQIEGYQQTDRVWEGSTAPQWTMIKAGWKGTRILPQYLVLMDSDDVDVLYIYYVWQNWLHILYCDWFWKSRLGETFEQCPSQNQSEKSGHIVHEPPLHDLKGFPLIECSIYVMGFWRKTHIGFFFPQFKLKSSAILKNLPVLTIISSDIDHWHWPVTLF